MIVVSMALLFASIFLIRYLALFFRDFECFCLRTFVTPFLYCPNAVVFLFHCYLYELLFCLFHPSFIVFHLSFICFAFATN